MLVLSRAISTRAARTASKKTMRVANASQKPAMKARFGRLGDASTETIPCDSRYVSSPSAIPDEYEDNQPCHCRQNPDQHFGRTVERSLNWLIHPASLVPARGGADADAPRTHSMRAVTPDRRGIWRLPVWDSSARGARSKDRSMSWLRLMLFRADSQ